MKNESLKFLYGGAEIQLPAETIVRNWLESLKPATSAGNAISAPAIGQAWQGGINAGLVRGADGIPDYFLIVSDPSTHLDEVQWGSQGETEPGACCQVDGAANTRALLSSAHSHPAAEQVAALRSNGFTDWYLPARRELSIAYGNVPELFEPKWYWSSTQYSASLAYGLYFYYGTQHGLNRKGARARAFAVRMIPVVQ